MESKLINYEIFISKRPDMEIHQEISIVSCINSSYVLLDGECASLISQVDNFNMVEDRASLDKENPLYRSDFEISQLQEALVFQTQYVLNMGNDFTIGGGSYSIGNVNSSFSRPEGRELIAPGVFKLLSNARVYNLNYFGTNEKKIKDIPLSTSKEIMERVKNEYVAINQPNGKEGQVAYINQSNKVSFGNPQDLQITTYNTKRIEGGVGHKNSFYEIDKVPNIAFFGPDLDGTYSAVHREEVLDMIKGVQAGNGEWGSITGDIENQQDLMDKLGEKVDKTTFEEDKKEQDNKINLNKSNIDFIKDIAIPLHEEKINKNTEDIIENSINIDKNKEQIDKNKTNIEANRQNIEENATKIEEINNRAAFKDTPNVFSEVQDFEKKIKIKEADFIYKAGMLQETNYQFKEGKFKYLGVVNEDKEVTTKEYVDKSINETNQNLGDLANKVETNSQNIVDLENKHNQQQQEINEIKQDLSDLEQKVEENTTNIETNKNDIASNSNKIESTSNLLNKVIEELKKQKWVNYKGSYIQGETYNVGDLVVINEHFYLSNSNNNATTPPSAKWDVIENPTGGQVDLSNYYTKLEVDNSQREQDIKIEELSNKVGNVEGNLNGNYYTKQESDTKFFNKNNGTTQIVENNTNLKANVTFKDNNDNNKYIFTKATGKLETANNPTTPNELVNKKYVDSIKEGLENTLNGDYYTKQEIDTQQATQDNKIQENKNELANKVDFVSEQTITGKKIFKSNALWSDDAKLKLISNSSNVTTIDIDNRKLRDLFSYNQSFTFNNDRQLVDKGYVDSAINNHIPNIDLSNYYTKQEVDNQQQAQDININSNTSEITNIKSNYFNKNNGNKQEIVNETSIKAPFELKRFSGQIGVQYDFENDKLLYYKSKNLIREDKELVTKEYVDSAIANNGGGGSNVDLSNYATLNGMNTFTGNINIFNEFVEIEGQLNVKNMNVSNYVSLDNEVAFNHNYLPTHTYSNGKLKKVSTTPIDDNKELTTKEYVDDAIANNVPTIDLSDYYTKSEVDTQQQAQDTRITNNTNELARTIKNNDIFSCTKNNSSFVWDSFTYNGKKYNAIKLKKGDINSIQIEYNETDSIGRITGISNPTSPNEVANKAYVDRIFTQQNTFSQTQTFSNRDAAIIVKPTSNTAAFVEIKNSNNQRIGTFGKGSTGSDNMGITAGLGDIEFSVPSNKIINFKRNKVEVDNPTEPKHVANKEYVDSKLGGGTISKNLVIKVDIDRYETTSGQITLPNNFRFENNADYYVKFKVADFWVTCSNLYGQRITEWEQTIGDWKIDFNVNTWFFRRRTGSSRDKLSLKIWKIE